MNMLVFGFGLLSATGICVIAGLALALIRQRSHFQAQASRRAEHETEKNRNVEALLKALEKSHEQQAINLSRLALSHLALKQDIMTLDAKLNRKDDQTLETIGRTPHILH